MIECIICTEKIINTSTKCKRCSNYFHDTCLLKWIKIKNSCPLCREEFNCVINYKWICSNKGTLYLNENKEWIYF